MRKCALFTINGNYNFGNKLQHYALQKFLIEYDLDVKTIYCYEDKRIILKLKNFIKFFVSRRYFNFIKFDKLIYYSKCYAFDNNLYKTEKFDYYIIGSDQVWNTTFPFFSKEYLLYNINSYNKISYASSFGIENLPHRYNKLFEKYLQHFKYISVREDRGKEIIEELTGRNDVKVLVDPTMLLNSEEWDNVSKIPKQINKLNGKKYILNYFLGNLSEQRKTEIERIAKENDCEIINILDEKDPFFVSGPSEFLYLEKNAFLICTDSFHSSVFAILYDRPFVVFDREDKEEKMNSRIDTLISKFNLKNRKYNGSKITKENLEHDYTEAYKILEEERKKSDAFLKKALDIKESE